MEIIDRIDKLIQFKKKFEKHAELGRGTLRKGKRIPSSLILPVYITESNNKIGYIKIELVIWLRFKDLINHPEIVKRELPDYENIVKDIKSIYQSLKPDTWMTFYGFEFIKAKGKNKA